SDESMLEHAELAEEGATLQGADEARPDALRSRQRGELLPAEVDRPVVGWQRSREQPEHSRLPGAVRADESRHGARLQLERDAVDRGDSPEVLREIVCAERLAATRRGSRS